MAKYKEITDLSDKVNNLTNVNKQLEEKVKNLPAESINTVVDDKKDGISTEKSEIQKFYDTTNSAQALYDSLP